MQNSSFYRIHMHWQIRHFHPQVLQCTVQKACYRYENQYGQWKPEKLLNSGQVHFRLIDTGLTLTLCRTCMQVANNACQKWRFTLCSDLLTSLTNILTFPYESLSADWQKEQIAPASLDLPTLRLPKDIETLWTNYIGKPFLPPIPILLQYQLRSI